MTYDDYLKLIEVLGVLAFSMTGIFEARRLKMDIVGAYSVAMITAFGGGTVRDVFLQRHPLFWITNWPYCVAVLILAIVSVAILRRIGEATRKKLVLVVTIFDALGLGLFSVLGSVYSLQVYPDLYFIAVIMGVVTGCFGGIIRDVIGNRVPTVFRKSQLYATCSLAGCVMYLLFAWLGLPAAVSIPFGIGVTFVVRMLAVRYNVSLPI
ncbi:MAG: trimeric intracellular cation channel family protein [Spirochaetia bacterium]|jgi:uncharacterized membrane protein YeiH